MVSSHSWHLRQNSMKKEMIQYSEFRFGPGLSKVWRTDANGDRSFILASASKPVGKTTCLLDMRLKKAIAQNEHAPFDERGGIVNVRKNVPSDDLTLGLSREDFAELIVGGFDAWCAVLQGGKASI